MIILSVIQLPQTTEKKRGVGWLIGCFGLNSPLKQYFHLYRAVSESKKREMTDKRIKMPKQPPPTLAASAIGPCPTLIQISRTPRHCQFTQHHRTTRPPSKRGQRKGQKIYSVNQVQRQQSTIITTAPKLHWNVTKLH